MSLSEYFAALSNFWLDVGALLEMHIFAVLGIAPICAELSSEVLTTTDASGQNASTPTGS
jgi:hypothetical protein